MLKRRNESERAGMDWQEESERRGSCQKLGPSTAAPLPEMEGRDKVRGEKPMHLFKRKLCILGLVRLLENIAKENWKVLET